MLGELADDRRETTGAREAYGGTLTFLSCEIEHRKFEASEGSW